MNQETLKAETARQVKSTEAVKWYTVLAETIVAKCNDNFYCGYTPMRTIASCSLLNVNSAIHQVLRYAAKKMEFHLKSKIGRHKMNDVVFK